MKALFTKHPHSMGETYFGHLMCAVMFGSKMLICGLACIIHAIFPFWFKNTGSDMLFQMLHDFIKRAPQPEERMQKLERALNEKSNAVIETAQCPF